jgi:Fe-S-cluster containining protein
MASKPWYASGLRFECTGCAACCKTHGEYAYVYVTRRDVAAISEHLGVAEDEFLETYCSTSSDGWIHLTMTPDDCPLLDKEGRCRVYPVRPKQCAAWPFWTENLEPAVWHGPVADCCPGVGRGRLYTAQEIRRIAKERDRWYG